MIRMPGHLANVTNEPLIVPDELPVTHDLDLPLAAANVQQHGGDPARFATALSRGLVDGVPADRADVLALVSLAGWRSGALTLRDDALARANALTDRAARKTAALVLGIETELGDFLKMQETDRFWWPGRAGHRGFVCALGGFSGVGGSWLAPPVEARTLAEPGAFGIRTGDDWWRADVDVWGVRLARLAAPPADAAPASVSTAPGLVSVVLTADSYLAWVHVGAGS